MKLDEVKVRRKSTRPRGRTIEEMKLPDHWMLKLDVSRKELTTLKGCPTRVDGSFDCSSNLLTSLEGCPKYIGGNLSMEENKITSLHDIHRLLPEMQEDAIITLDQLSIKSHVLGLLKVKGLTYINGADYEDASRAYFQGKPDGRGRWIGKPRWEQVINHYLNVPERKADIYGCQDTLIELGLEEYARA